MNFIGLDTETIKGYARLVCLSDGRVFKIKDKTDVIKLFEEFSKECFIAFNADYDIQSLLKYFPGRVIDKLSRGISTAYGKKQMFYIKDKFLKFGSNYIFDVMQFFHSSLERAAKKYLNKEKGGIDYEILDENKIYSKEVIDSCINHANLSLDLFNYFRESVPKSVKECKPFSSASYAQDFFKDEIRLSLPRKKINDLFYKAYRGGRFELVQRGYFKNVFMYDINSAYPDELSKLKTFSINTRMKCIPEYEPEAEYSVYHLKVNFKRDHFSPLVYNDGMRLIYPHGRFKIWVTKTEYEALDDSEKEILFAFHIFIPDEDQENFPFKSKMAWLYEKKKNSNNREAYKIILNGLYGKLAQRIFRYVSEHQFLTMYKDENIIDFYTDWEGNKYIQYIDDRNSNFIYAGEITARCRMKMYDVANTKPDKIIGIATDSIICEETLGVPISDKMGDWHEEKWDELYMIGCGVYFYRIKDKWYSKNRGFPMEGQRVKDRLDKIISSNFSEVTYKISSKLSLRQARIRHTEWMANIIGTEEKKINLNMDRKRVWDRDFLSGKDVLSGAIRSGLLRLPFPVPVKVKRYPFFPKYPPQIWLDIMDVTHGRGICPFRGRVEIEEYKSGVPKPLRRRAGVPPDEVADLMGFEGSKELYEALSVPDRGYMLEKSAEDYELEYENFKDNA